MLKKIGPARLAKGKFTSEVEAAEDRGATVEELRELLGKGRAKKGMFEGNLDDGELEIGQIATLIRESKSVAEVISEVVSEFQLCKQRIATF